MLEIPRDFSHCSARQVRLPTAELIIMSSTNFLRGKNESGTSSGGAQARSPLPFTYRGRSKDDFEVLPSGLCGWKRLQLFCPNYCSRTLH